MSNTDKNVMQVPTTFDFPFPPYDIQLEFMKKLYYTLENSKLGIFESPTGTGKSLSIICGAIKWLKDRQIFEKQSLTEDLSKLNIEKQKISEETTDWLRSQSKLIEINSELCALKMKESNILRYEKKLSDLVNFHENKVKRKLKFIYKQKDKQRIEPEKKTNLNEIDDYEFDEDFLPEKYQNDDDIDNPEEEEEIEYEPIKIYICSRTHSQLSQFLGEIAKSPYGNSIRVVSLASRQSYCINSNVTNLKSMALINERCLDLQKKVPKPKTDCDGKVTKKAKGSCSCPFYKQTAIEELTSHTLSEITDIEDLIKTGKLLNACPYYSSRKAAVDAEIILIPYNTLLHKPTRDANGIKLKNNVIIIDEAHNILEAVTQMYNTELTYSQVFHALQQLKAYKERFKLRFNSDNLLIINKILFVITKLKKYLDESCASTTSTISLTITRFVIDTGIDRYNMFELTKFSKEARLAQKLKGFSNKYPVQPEKEKAKSGLEGIRAFMETIQSKSRPDGDVNKTQNKSDSKEEEIPLVSNPFLAVLAFLDSLTCSPKDAKILLTKATSKIDCKLQFLILNPSEHFREIIRDARAVVVAGGTMKPISEFKDRLFINAGAEKDRIVEFSCEHIVLPENILPIIVTHGANKGALVFNYEKRMSLMHEVKDILIQACKIVTGGVVVFFPSYEYENLIMLQLKSVDFGRKLFREPKLSSDVENVLTKYANAIKAPGSRGALLFSVVGGKLSEGLNFSDDLGRCVIVVGMPYSNITAPDLKEKMAYLDKTEGSGSGQKFYENLCMKAVNQCIGRAVRHRNDYATVLLVDQRYCRQQTMNALPNWIKKSLKIANYSEAMQGLNEFFEIRRKKK